MRIEIYEVFTRGGELIRTRFVSEKDSRFIQHYLSSVYSCKNKRSCFLKDKSEISPKEQAKIYDKKHKLNAVLVATIEV